MPSVEIFPHIPNHHFILPYPLKDKEQKRSKTKRKIDHTNCLLHSFLVIWNE